MCTAATYQTDDFYMGRTLDYEFSYGEEITVMPRRFPLEFRHGGRTDEQEAAVTGLRFGDEYYDDLREKYTAKRDLFIKGLNDIGIKHTVPQGAYYVMLDISEFGFESDLEFCDVLARDVGVGAVPGSSFFREPVNNLIRLHFAKKDETLYEALNRLSDIRKKIAKR